MQIGWRSSGSIASAQRRLESLGGAHTLPRSRPRHGLGRGICARIVRTVLAIAIQGVGADGRGLADALPSASLATVREPGVAKSLAGMDFGRDADNADGADGCTPSRSGARSVDAAVARMIRVRARPSLPQPISLTILRGKVAARRSRPASARAPSGHA
jgi:hypothetical protein